MLKLALTPRWLGALLLALLFATSFMFLSKWQLGSASSNQVHADPAKEVVRPLGQTAKPFEPVLATEADTMVRTTGHYVPHSTVLVSDRLNDGTKGYWIVSRFVPSDSSATTTADGKKEQTSLGVARAFTTAADPSSLPAEPTGDVSLAGRLIANEGPVTSKDAGSTTILGSPATAQLTNLWDAPLYSGVVVAAAEVPASTALPLDSAGKVPDTARPMDLPAGYERIRADQVTDDSLNWLNLFYALEWVVFAGFALFLWWHMLRDDYRRRQHPELFYELEAEGPTDLLYEESTGRYFYYDPEQDQYFYYDDPEDPAGTDGSTAPETTR